MFILPLLSVKKGLISVVGCVWLDGIECGNTLHGLARFGSSNSHTHLSQNSHCSAL